MQHNGTYVRCGQQGAGAAAPGNMESSMVRTWCACAYAPRLLITHSLLVTGLICIMSSVTSASWKSRAVKLSGTGRKP